MARPDRGQATVVADLVIQCDYSDLTEIRDEMEIFQITDSKPLSPFFLSLEYFFYLQMKGGYQMNGTYQFFFL